MAIATFLMKKSLHALATVLVLWICELPIHAQQSDISIEWFHEAGGVELDGGGTILQDRNGFMWFGTFGGLYKYDGYKFEVFTHDPGDTTSVSNSWVDILYEDREGTLWIGTVGGGLNRFNRETNTFTRFTHDENDSTSISPGQVGALLEDRSGTFWVGTDRGLNQFDPDTGTFLHYVHPENDPPEFKQSRAKTICEDRFGRLWIGTDEVNPNGIFRYDPSTESFTHYVNQPGNYGSLYHNRVNDILEDSRGDIWVTTAGGVLHRYDAESDSFERYRLDPDNPNGFKDPLREDFEPVLDNVWGFGLHEATSQPGFLWIGSSGYGLFRVGLITRDFTHYTDDENTYPRLSNMAAWDFVEDRKGVLWAISTAGGAHKIRVQDSWLSHYEWDPAEENGLSDRRPMLLWEDSQGSIWIGYGSASFDLLDPTMQRVEQIGDPLEQLREEHSLKNVLFHWFIERGILILTKTGDFFLIDPVLGTVTPPAQDESWDSIGVNPTAIQSAYGDRAGNIWLNAVGERFLQYQPATGSIETSYTFHRGSISRPIFDDSDGHLWFRMYSNNVADLVRYNVSAKTYDFFETTYQVYQVVKDDRGRFWGGTFNGGLLRINTEKKNGDNAFDRRWIAYQSHYRPPHGR